MCRVESALVAVQDTVYSVQGTVYSVQCTWRQVYRQEEGPQGAAQLDPEAVNAVVAWEAKYIWRKAALESVFPSTCEVAKNTNRTGTECNTFPFSFHVCTIHISYKAIGIKVIFLRGNLSVDRKYKEMSFKTICDLLNVIHFTQAWFQVKKIPHMGKTLPSCMCVIQKYHDSKSIPWVLSIPWVHAYTMSPYQCL